jgi:acyl-coenzyme A synthetase/AMP-(fatty) acid ligase
MRQGLKPPELEEMLRRLRPALYLGHADLYGPVAPIDLEVLPGNARFVVGGPGTGAARPWTDLQGGAPAPERRIDPAAPAVLLATTGTTGKPKLVAQSHESLAAFVRQATYIGIQPGQVIAHLVPMGHMAGLAILLASLCNGAIFVILDAADRDGTLDAIEAHRCTYLPGVPVMFGQLVEAQRRRPRNMASLQVCYSIADVCPSSTQEAFEAAFGKPLRSVWGMTEVIGPYTWGTEPGTVFRPLPNVEVRLLDGDGRDVAPGEPGEFAVRGACVSLGYWTSPGRVTAFPAGWCCTGDIMRQDGAGNIWFISRANDVIKRHGQFVFPAEVEAVLSAHPAVRDAGVAGLPDGNHGHRVVGFVQLAQGAEPGALEGILQAAALQLAGHKLPERLVPVHAVPRNALGKIDRKQLALMDNAGPEV